jgi:hypothetical protein
VRGNCNTAALPDLLDDLIGDAAIGALAVHGPSQVVHDHRRAPRRQVKRVQAPQSAACTGDDNGLVREVDHAANSSIEVKT